MFPWFAVLVVTFHVDLGFSQHERLLIASAAELLTRQTAGQLSVGVQWDLDFRDTAMVRRLATEPSILRLEIWDPKIGLVDAASGVHVVGFTDRPRVYLVPERILESAQAGGKEPDLVFTHVVMHEILHDVGVTHVPDPQSIMWLNASPTLWLTGWDWAAIFKALDKRQELNILGP